MSTPANDTRPLQPLTFLAAAIRAELYDLIQRTATPNFVNPYAIRIADLCTEIERHAGGNPK